MNDGPATGEAQITVTTRAERSALSLSTPTARLEEGPFGALSSVDLSVHFRTHPERADVGPETFFPAVFRSRVAHRGYIEEDGGIWSRDGSLLAQSRSLALLLEA